MYKKAICGFLVFFFSFNMICGQVFASATVLKTNQSSSNVYSSMGSINNPDKINKIPLERVEKIIELLANVENDENKYFVKLSTDFLISAVLALKEKDPEMLLMVAESFQNEIAVISEDIAISEECLHYLIIGLPLDILALINNIFNLDQDPDWYKILWNVISTGQTLLKYIACDLQVSDPTSPFLRDLCITIHGIDIVYSIFESVRTIITGSLPILEVISFFYSLWSLTQCFENYTE